MSLRKLTSSTAFPLTPSSALENIKHATSMLQVNPHHHQLLQQAQMQQQHHWMSIWRLWHLLQTLNWMNGHRQYISLGVVLAEYATKTCLGYLPEDQRHTCAHMLKYAGVDLRSVDATTVGTTALSLAMTGAPVDALYRGAQQQPPPVAVSSSSSSSSSGVSSAGVLTAASQGHLVLAHLDPLLHDVMREIRHIAAMPPTLPMATHHRFVTALGSIANHSALEGAAQCAYGADWAPWTRGGLTSLLLDKPRATSASLTLREVESAYTAWHAFAVKAESHLLGALGAETLRAFRI